MHTPEVDATQEVDRSRTPGIEGVGGRAGTDEFR